MAGICDVTSWNPIGSAPAQSILTGVVSSIMFGGILLLLGQESVRSRSSFENGFKASPNMPQRVAPFITVSYVAVCAVTFNWLAGEDKARWEGADAKVIARAAVVTGITLACLAIITQLAALPTYSALDQSESGDSVVGIPNTRGSTSRIESLASTDSAKDVDRGNRTNPPLAEITMRIEGIGAMRHTMVSPG